MASLMAAGGCLAGRPPMPQSPMWPAGRTAEHHAPAEAPRAPPPGGAACCRPPYAVFAHNAWLLAPATPQRAGRGLWGWRQQRMYCTARPARDRHGLRPGAGLGGRSFKLGTGCEGSCPSSLQVAHWLDMLVQRPPRCTPRPTSAAQVERAIEVVRQKAAGTGLGIECLQADMVAPLLPELQASAVGAAGRACLIWPACRVGNHGGTSLLVEEARRLAVLLSCFYHGIFPCRAASLTWCSTQTCTTASRPAPSATPLWPTWRVSSGRVRAAGCCAASGGSQAAPAGFRLLGQALLTPTSSRLDLTPSPALHAPLPPHRPRRRPRGDACILGQAARQPRPGARVASRHPRQLCAAHLGGGVD